jgi:valyl-tRNA synthetase
VHTASRFARGRAPAPEHATPTEPLDLAILDAWRTTIAEATAGFEEYEYTRAIERIETRFWSFCDDELELLKSRAYAGDASALATLRLSLSVLLRLFAPFLPYCTEEVWSWFADGSVHRATWPTVDDLPSGGDPTVLAVAAEVLGALRKAKTEAKRSMKSTITRAEVADTPERIAAARLVASDLRDAGNVVDLVLTEAGDDAALTVAVELEALPE